MENRIKEQLLMLFATRASCHAFLANPFRLLLSAAAYVRIEHLRRTALANTELAAAQVDTIRLRLLKVAARVVVSVRRVVLHISSAYPWQNLFRRIVAALVSAAAPRAALPAHARAAPRAHRRAGPVAHPAPT